MTTAKIKTAEATAPMLSAFHTVGEKSLQGVWKVYTEGSLDRLVLDFGEMSLIITADENDDSIDTAVADITDARDSGAVDGSNQDPWRALMGKPFGWGWVTVNQQGYCDGLMLSFGGIVPQILLHVIASSIKVGAIPSIG